MIAVFSEYPARGPENPPLERRGRAAFPIADFFHHLMETYPLFPLKSKKMALRLLLDFSRVRSLLLKTASTLWSTLSRFTELKCYNGARNSR
jgi:hypothetical protein